MAKLGNGKIDTFKFNMSFYYQSTIIYFIVFILYTLIRGEFIEGSFVLIMQDPLIYFFCIIVLVSLISLLYNIYKKKYLKINENGILFMSRFKSKIINIEQIEQIRILGKKKIPLADRQDSENDGARLIRIKLKNKKRGFFVRPYDYENENQLVERFQELKIGLENNV